MPRTQAISGLMVVGPRRIETRDILPTQHFMEFENPAEGVHEHQRPQLSWVSVPASDHQQRRLALPSVLPEPA